MDNNLYNECIELLNKRGVLLDDIKELVYDLQRPYIDNIDELDIDSYIVKTLEKREVQNAIITGINLDIAAENNQLLSDSLTKIMMNDNGLYGVDEVLAYGICNLYGSIALTNFGYLDKTKPKIIGKLNAHQEGKCNVFLDDIVAAIIASVASKLAHNNI